MEIKLCGKCKGIGKIEIYKSASLESDLLFCPTCKGHGRLLSRTYTLEMPIGNKNEFNELDSKIIKLINNK